MKSLLHYLQSRYYNPEIGRFISKDDSGYHDASNQIDSNLYAYVNNNPINNSDPNGHFINTILGGLFGAGFGWLSAKLTGGDPQAGAVSGLVGGMIAGFGADLAAACPAIGVLTVAVTGAASAVISQIIYTCMTVQNVDAKYFTQPEVLKNLVFVAILGGVFNVCGYGWGNSLGYGTPPPELSILQKLVYMCSINIQEVRNSIAGSVAINRIVGTRQLVISQIYDYLQKNG